MAASKTIPDRRRKWLKNFLRATAVGFTVLVALVSDKVSQHSALSEIFFFNRMRAITAYIEKQLEPLFLLLCLFVA